MLVDTHAHLYWESFKSDFDEMIKRALDAKVATIINVGVDVELSEKALRQASFDKAQDRQGLADIPGLTTYSTIGIHPHEALRIDGKDGLEGLEENIKQLEQIYNSNPEKVIAIGECGLDFAFGRLEGLEGIDAKTIKIKQRQLFQAQIDLAKKLKLPLIVHCRDDRSKNAENSECWDEVLEMTKDWYGVYHCYSGLPHNTEYIIHNTNFLVSFAGNLTYPKNEYLREAAKIIPLERIVLETDCPFLPPQSKRGERNEPQTVREIAQMIAELKKVSLQEVALKTTNNVKIVFNL